MHVGLDPTPEKIIDLHELHKNIYYKNGVTPLNLNISSLCKVWISKNLIG